MTLSVNNNAAAQLALQSLDQVTQNLQTADNQVSTGLAIQSAKDNAAIWSIAQGQRQQVSALSAVSAGLNRVSSISDVASGAGHSVSDLLAQIKQTVLSANDSSLDTASRNALASDFKSQLNQITEIVNTASFDGVNLLDGSTPTMQILANADGSQMFTVQGVNLSLGGSIISLAQTDTLGTVTDAASALSHVNASITALNTALGQLGSQSNLIDSHTTFVSKLSDTLNTGIGSLVDADLAQESARLQALQVQQQIAAQSVQIANASPQSILSLFKGG